MIKVEMVSPDGLPSVRTTNELWIEDHYTYNLFLFSFNLYIFFLL